MDDNKHPLQKIFGDEAPALPAPIEPPPDDDFEFVRSNLRDLIQKTKTTMATALDVAEAGQHPRQFEAAAGMVKALLDANKELLDAKLVKQKVMGQEPPTTQVNNTQNNLYLSSAAFMDKMREPVEVGKLPSKTIEE